MSSKYFLFVLILIATAARVKSQTLLNADLSKIRKDVKLQGGVLKNTEINRRYKKVVFHYPLPPEGNTCLMKTTFYLTLKNKCFKYVEDYWGKELAYRKIDALKKYYSGLKQVKDELKWVDNDKGFELGLIKRSMGSNKFASAYLLEIKKINIKSD